MGLDLVGRSIELLPIHREQQPRRYHGYERGRQCDVSRQLEGVQGPRDWRQREQEGRKTILEG